MGRLINGVVSVLAVAAGVVMCQNVGTRDAGAMIAWCGAVTFVAFTVIPWKKGEY